MQGSLKEIMSSEQSMTQAIIQAAIEATKAVITAAGGRNPSQQCKANTNCAKNRQPMCIWKGLDNYHELCNFKIEVKNILLTNNYNI